MYAVVAAVSDQQRRIFFKFRAAKVNLARVVEFKLRIFCVSCCTQVAHGRTIDSAKDLHAAIVGFAHCYELNARFCAAN
jgi:hypothetical protein